MLTHLHISNLVSVRSLDLDFGAGMTVITGESGAGKSLLIHALLLVSGGRGDSDMIRAESDFAEVTAAFDLDDSPLVRQWLLDHHLMDEDVCLLRRVLPRDGRSRSFINGTPVNVRQLRTIGEMLLSLHLQQSHQELLRPSQQLRILDSLTGQMALRKETGRLYEAIDRVARALSRPNSPADQSQDRLSLLVYQLEELEAAAIGSGEIQALEIEHSRLANLQDLKAAVFSALTTLSGESDSTADSLSKSLETLQQIQATAPELGIACDLLDTSLVNLLEAVSELKRYSDGLNEDPKRLEWVEARLALLGDLARKHKVSPAELHKLTSRLCEQKEQLEQAKRDAESLQTEKEQLEAAYAEQAARLRQARTTAAAELSTKVNAWLPDMGMPNSRFGIDVDADKPSSTGTERVTYMLSTFEDQPTRPLTRVVSGGELSRISLVIQLLSKVEESLPTMVLDEADAGIGGIVAAKVGLLLRQLASQRQVLTVTHLPQIAVYGHTHLCVEKTSRACDNPTSFKWLDKGERTAEIARMLAGSDLTRRNLAHASEMLERAASS